MVKNCLRITFKFIVETGFSKSIYYKQATNRYERKKKKKAKFLEMGFLLCGRQDGRFLRKVFRRMSPGVTNRSNR